jgi:hypothetical protein
VLGESVVGIGSKGSGGWVPPVAGGSGGSPPG